MEHEFYSERSGVTVRKNKGMLACSYREWEITSTDQEFWSLSLRVICGHISITVPVKKIHGLTISLF